MKAVLRLFLLLFPLSLSAATYYVDFAAGSDAANGTATGTPWKHCPGDSGATGNAAAATLSVGDSVIFKGGAVYWATNSTTGISVATSGSLASRITYDGTGASWGTGKAVIDGGYITNACGFTINRGINNITVNGFEIRNMGGFADDDPIVIAAANGDYGNGSNAFSVQKSGYGVYMNAGVNTNVTLANLYLHRMGIWHHTLGWNGSSVSGHGIWAESPVGLTITNCEFTQCGGGAVYVSGGETLVKDVLITDCYAHDEIPVWTIDFAANNAGVVFTNISITKTRIINVGSQWTGTPESGGFGQPHQNYVFIRGNGVLSYWQNVSVTRCLMMETNLVEDTGGTGTIHINNGASCDVYNNIFCRPNTYNGILYLNAVGQAGMTQTVRFCNNTLLRLGGGMIDNGFVTTNVFLLNNLFVDCTNLTANSPRLSGYYALPQVSDYNLYWHPTITTNAYVAGLIQSPYTGYSFPALKSLGYEANGQFADPLFVNATNYVTPGLSDLRLLPGSPAIGAGTNLSSLFTTDYAGNARPAGAWTVGAYEGVPATPVMPNTPGVPPLGIMLMQFVRTNAPGALLAVFFPDLSKTQTARLEWNPTMLLASNWTNIGSFRLSQ